MSFLNPVNEPVKRFSSTDAGAPQINYNSRVAGDVKTVLKACLVTGYGATAGAGWSIVNEVDHVAEFVSPSVAMTDYRLGIDDTSASSTAWYYQYQDVRTNPKYANPTKNITALDELSANNGWQMFATHRGIIFVELLQHKTVQDVSARITYIGSLKIASKTSGQANFCFYNIGHNSPQSWPSGFYRTNDTHYNIAEYKLLTKATALSLMSSEVDYKFGLSKLDMAAKIYLASEGACIAEHPGILGRTINDPDQVYGVGNQSLDGRSVFAVCAGSIETSVQYAISRARAFYIYVDYWEY